MFVATGYPGTEMFRHPDVQKKLRELFGISFDARNEPVADKKLENYVLQLNDATDLVKNKAGAIANYSAMTDEEFLTARDFVNSGTPEKILNM